MRLDEIQWGEIWLALATDTVVQFEHSPTRLASVKPLIGRANPSVKDRGNSVNTFTFGVLREHESISVARAFILAHAKALEAAAQTTTRSLVLRYFAYPPTIYTCANAALTSYPSYQRGVSTRHTYTLTTGAIT